MAEGKAVDHDDLLFTTATAMPVEPRNFNRFWDRAIWDAGIVRITVRAARATCATLLKALNVHPRIAQRILRHAQVSITMEIDMDVIDDDTREALGSWGTCWQETAVLAPKLLYGDQLEGSELREEWAARDSNPEPTD